MYSGIISISASNELLNIVGLSPQDLVFITIYIPTVIDGILLSIIVASVALLTRLIIMAGNKFKHD